MVSRDTDAIKEEPRIALIGPDLVGRKHAAYVMASADAQLAGRGEARDATIP